MSDLIKREDAIKAIEELPNAYNGWSDAYDKAYIIGTLEEVPSADRPQEWIPCSERLPKENTEVLMSLEWGIDIGECRDGDWHSEWINHYDDGNVLAWMPLPKPYGEREGE